MNIYLHALREDLRNPLHIILVFLLPIPVLFIPAHPHSFPFGLTLYGMMLFYSAFLLSRPIVEDRMQKIVIRIAASPVSTLQYLASHLLAYVTLLIVQIGIFLMGSLILHGDLVWDRIGLFALYISFSIMCIAFTLAWNMLFRSFTISFAVFAGVASLMCLFSGVSMPLFLLPTPIIRYIMFLPTYWLPHGIEALYHGDVGAIAQSHMILLAYAVIFLLLGSKRRL